MKLRMLAMLHLLRNAGCVDRDELNHCHELTQDLGPVEAFEYLVEVMERDATVLPDAMVGLMADLAAELGVSCAPKEEAAPEATSRDYRCRVNDELKTCVVVNDCSSPIEAAESVALDHWSCLPDDATVETLTIYACDGKRVFKLVIKPKLTCTAEVESCEECEVN
jgi:hypothetical protein